MSLRKLTLRPSILIEKITKIKYDTSQILSLLKCPRVVNLKKVAMLKVHYALE